MVDGISDSMLILFMEMQTLQRIGINFLTLEHHALIAWDGDTLLPKMLIIFIIGFIVATSETVCML
jgi:hypothetical protein